MGFFDRISQGLQRSRDKFKEEMNVLLDRGPDLDEEFWDGLEETLILADIGGAAACDIVENLRDQATRKALPDAYAVLDMLNDQIADTFTEGGREILGGEPACVLFVGINGTGKTTTVGKLSKEAHDAGRKVILGSADTFRAAAIEQLEVWAKRADVEMVTRERGADPASVCYDTIERAEAEDADLVLIDTAGAFTPRQTSCASWRRSSTWCASARSCPSTPCSSSTPPPVRTACSRRASSTVSSS